MEDHKKKGTCYNYNKKFQLGHYCATKKLYVLDADSPMEPPEEDFEDIMVDIKEESDQPTEVVPKIYCNALYEFTSP